MSDIHCSVVRVSTEHCFCVAVLQGPFWCRRAIVQGGVVWKEDVSSDMLMKELPLLLSRLKVACRKKHCVYVEIRNFDDYADFRHLFEQQGFAYNPHYDVHLRIASPETMFSRMHESKQRALRRALAEGQTWHEAATEEEVRKFYGLLKTLYRKKVKRPLPSLDFFLQACRQGVKVLVTEHKGVVTGGVLMPVMEKGIEEKAGDSKVAYEWYICGGVMSTWAMMEWGSQNGVSMIDMMGAGEPQVKYGVRDFKLQMGGELHEFGRFVWVRGKLRYWLGRLIISRL